MRNISIEIQKNLPVSEQEVEIVERKGRGHPDYICDAIMEDISLALCREYIREFGEILHHNIDKGLLVAGQVERRFGGGRVVKPMELVIGDRAVYEAGGRKIPVDEIAVETAKAWFRKNLRFVEPTSDVAYRVVLSPGSEELTGIFDRGGRLHPANDTSAAVGYSPLTKTEKAVFDIERFLNSEGFKGEFPEAGEDVKIMGLRQMDSLGLTIAMPLVARYVEDEGDYFRRKELIMDALHGFAEGLPFKKVSIHYNTLDKKGYGLGGVYLSLLGTSAEDGDSGQVGRGNRINGLIPLNRPVGTEAAAGKNPVSHPGKIYTILAYELAGKIYQDIDGIKEVYVWLVSRIGASIDMPQLASAQLILKKGVKEGGIRERARDIVESGLARTGRLCEELIEGRYPVC